MILENTIIHQIFYFHFVYIIIFKSIFQLATVNFKATALSFSKNLRYVLTNGITESITVIESTSETSLLTAGHKLYKNFVIFKKVAFPVPFLLELLL